MTKDETIKQALEAYCKTLHPLWNTGISRAEAEGFFNAGFKAAQELPKQAQSEPVAWMYDWIRHDGDFIQDWTTSDAESLRDTEPTIITNVRPLYATPQPCPTCEALARTVMMDQTGRDL
jgi:hypothetical protein